LIKLQSVPDNIAISLSLLCTLHCLALPLILVLIPSVASLQLQNEAFHFWMVLVVIPVSLYALTLGCKQHNRVYIFAIGGTGLSLLLMAVILPEPLLGEYGEKITTLLGASLIAIAHFTNYRLCQQQERCKCS